MVWRAVGRWLSTAGARCLAWLHAAELTECMRRAALAEAELLGEGPAPSAATVGERCRRLVATFRGDALLHISAWVWFWDAFLSSLQEKVCRRAASRPLASESDGLSRGSPRPAGDGLSRVAAARRGARLAPWSAVRRRRSEWLWSRQSFLWSGIDVVSQTCQKARRCWRQAQGHEPPPLCRASVVRHRRRAFELSRSATSRKNRMRIASVLLYCRLLSTRIASVLLYCVFLGTCLLPLAAIAVAYGVVRCVSRRMAQSHGRDCRSATTAAVASLAGSIASSSSLSPPDREHVRAGRRGEPHIGIFFIGYVLGGCARKLVRRTLGKNRMRIASVLLYCVLLSTLGTCLPPLAAIAVAYGVVRCVSRRMAQSHGRDCRSATTAAVASATALVASPGAGVLAGAFLVLAPSKFLWWPPKLTEEDYLKKLLRMEKWVVENLAALRERPGADLFQKLRQRNGPTENALYMDLKRYSKQFEKGRCRELLSKLNAWVTSDPLSSKTSSPQGAAQKRPCDDRAPGGMTTPMGKRPRQEEVELAAASADLPASSRQGTPAMKRQTPDTPLCTPQVKRCSAQSPVGGAAVCDAERTPALTPRAAEALARSTRKPDLSPPTGIATVANDGGLAPSSRKLGSDEATLLDGGGARHFVKQLYKELKQFREEVAMPEAWPTQRQRRNLYMRLYRFRTTYMKAMRGDEENAFTVDDIRLLGFLAGRGPQDHALGLGALGQIESLDDGVGGERTWRWTFAHLGTDAHGDLHDTEAAAVADLALAVDALARGVAGRNVVRQRKAD